MTEASVPAAQAPTTPVQSHVTIQRPPPPGNAPPTGNRPPPGAGPRPAAPGAQAPAVSVPAKTWSLSTGRVARGEAVLLHGEGGSGKSTLAATIPNAVFLDLNRGTRQLPVTRATLPSGQEWTFDLVRAFVQSLTAADCATLVIDTATEAEALAQDWTVKNVPHEKGYPIRRIEDYGFGKGYQNWHEVFVLLLADLDRLADRGVNVVLVAHSVRATVPNPAGEDYLRFEPRLYAGGKDGKSSTRAKAIEWADHVLFLGLDVAAKDGKGQGGTTRTLYTQCSAAWVAKTRNKVDDAVPVEAGDGSIWSALGIVGKKEGA